MSSLTGVRSLNFMVSKIHSFVGDFGDENELFNKFSIRCVGRKNGHLSCIEGHQQTVPSD